MPEVIDAQQLNADSQLQASLRYANALYSQLRSHRSENNQLLRNLAMLTCSLLEREIVVNRGEEEDDAPLWAECAVAVATCVIHRLGFDVRLVPSQVPLEIRYYSLEFLHPERDCFELRLSIPATVSVAEYAKFCELRKGAKLQQIRPLTEEEWQKDRKKTKPAEKRADQKQAVTEPKLIPTIEERRFRFSPEEVALLGRFERVGALQAFAEAQSEVSEKFPQGAIRDIDKHFLVYLRSMVPYSKKIPHSAHIQFMQAFEGKLTYYQANQIVMVLEGGELRRFVPLFAMANDGNINTSSGYIPSDQHLLLKSVLPSMRYFGGDVMEEPTPPAPVTKAKSASPKKAPSPKKDPEPPPVDPPFDLAKAYFTCGALLRFASFARPKVKESLERDALAMLARANEEGAISSEGLVKRAISHNFEEARYFRHGQYRFVVKEDREQGIFKILTFEEIRLL
jgi:hypothetical protein